MSEWSVQRVEQLAPDAAAVKAAQGIAKPANWRSVGRSERLLWGECQGSGANPYQVRVDLEDGACKCSCPSRKLPCKHALGLLLLLAGGASIPIAPLPEFAEEWAAARTKRAETKVARASAAEKQADPDGQARRIEKREARVEAGIEQLESWLADIVAQGLAATRSQSPQFWSQMAARLVDAQAPGLARRVRELSELAVTGEDWQSTLLAGLARLQLLIDACRKLEQLPAALAAEVRTLIGWTQSQEVLLQREGVRDRWQVLGHRQDHQDQIRVQYTWLVGTTSAQPALILDFAAGNQPLPATLRTGQVTDAELVYFDGTPPLRALLKQRFDSGAVRPTFHAPMDVLGLQNRFAALLAVNPWLDRWPAVLGPVTPLLESDRTHFVDAAGRRVTARRGFKHTWHLTALAGGAPVALFGLWDGHVFDPITVGHDDQLFSIYHAGEIPVLSKVG